MKVLVTGGAGYIGSHTCIEVLKNCHDLCIVDNLSNSKKDSLERVKQITNKEFSFHNVDICDYSSLMNVFKTFKPEAVIHFAGHKSINESINEPLKYYYNNVFGSINLLKVMDSNDCFNIVFSSSATVYGKPEYVPIDELHRVQPENPYGQSKLAVENILRDWSGKNKKSFILRYFNPIGAHESGLIGECSNSVPNNLIPYIEEVILGKQAALRIFGNDYDTKDGTGVRDFIHVEDLANSHVQALESFMKITDYEVLNIGTGIGASVLEILDCYNNEIGYKLPFSIESRRQGDVSVSIANPSKAENKIGWKAAFTYSDAIKSSRNWKTKNPNGYSN